MTSPSVRRSEVLGVVLAAGASTRAGGPKALACFGGEPLVARAIRTAHEGGCREVLVVTAAPWGGAIAAVAARRGAWTAHNSRPERGMLSSLQIALLRAIAHHAVLVSLVDHPHVQPRTVRALIAAWRLSGASLVRPRHQGRRGHPYVVDARLVAPLLDLPPTASPRALFGSLSDARELEVDDPGVLEDLDTRSALEALGAHMPA
ncbi:MAG: nucleotidyltransferase family protein [Myxococcales bacterium]|nr:nucleotidyltransferase family protein [Myxococcales bacterium]